jgi:hypothetical protein
MSKRIFERMRDEHGYAGGLTIGKATDWLDKAAPPPPTAKSFDGA